MQQETEQYEMQLNPLFQLIYKTVTADTLGGATGSPT
jgi:hypothetical protein